MTDVPAPEAAPRRYARWLSWGTRASLVALVLAFSAYATGLLAPHVPIERLPQLWGLASGEFLRQTGIAPGWGWAALIDRGDVLNMAGIALLASCSIPCLAAVIGVFRARGERALALVCALEIAVLLVAASGLLAGGH
jgi:hypothetical protein